MAISRKRALEQIAGVSPKIQEHLRKLRAFPFARDYNHWRGEAMEWIAQVEAAARHVGRRTGSEVLSRVAQWKQEIDRINADRND